ncbi:hypothetical protein MNBD_NITROSPINAE04-58 [hydrothermal vent metagenome]|uniref:Glycosyl transferase family 1 domain-containing protein n=1 Tax=hydrothermal vent metagenome TaxID=652676 RepID=A0A3B1CIB7_9ZZZZ
MLYKSSKNTRPVILFTDFKRQSYAMIGRLYKFSLESIGINVDEIQTPHTAEERKKDGVSFQGRIILHNTIGPLFEPVPGARNIALPAHEWSLYPDKWVEKLNRFDEVWVTTDHVYNTLKKSHVATPIHTLPPELDIDPVTEKNSWEPDGTFQFFSCGEPHFRKGFHLLMEGFMRAFPEPGIAALTIKTSPACGWKSPRDDIKIIAKNMTRNDVLVMYSKYDAYVSASLGEGLGLPVAEAIQALLPVATNYWGGHKSLLKEGAFWLINHDEVDQPYCSDPSYFASGQKCAFSHPDKIAQTLKAVAESSASERKNRAVTARDNLLERYGEKAVRDRLKKHFGL